MIDAPTYLGVLEAVCGDTSARGEEYVKLQREDRLYLQQKVPGIDQLLRDFSEDEIRKMDGNQSHHYRTTLVKHLLSSMMNYKPVVEDVHVGYLPTRSLNARTLRAPNGDPLVVMHGNNHQFFALVMEAFIGTERMPLDVRESFGSLMEWNVLSFYLIEYLRTMGERELPRFPQKTWTKDEFRRIVQHAWGVEAFMLMHEYGHVVLHHNSTAELGALALSKRNGDDVELDAFIHPWNREFEADMFAWRLWEEMCQRIVRLDIFDPKPDYNDAARIPFVFLACQEMLENCAYRDAKSSTHPPCAARFARLRSEAGAELDAEINHIVRYISFLEPVVAQFHS